MNKGWICRACAYEGDNMDWNEPVFGVSGMSFKECYYKYTHLNETVPDPFPQSLCANCSTELQNFHLWIEKAIVTQKLFEQSFKTSSVLTSKVEDVENAETFGCNTSQDISKDSVEGELSESNLKNKRVPANSTGINFKNHKSCRKSRLHGRNIACMSVTNLGCTIDDTQIIVGIQPCDIKSKHSDNSHFHVSTDNSGLISDIKIESEIISDICAKNNQRDIRKRRTVSSHAQDHCSNESVALANSVPECVYIQENNDTNLEMINESEISPHNSKDLKKDKLVPFENLNFSENQSNVENANSSDLQISELKDEIKPLGKFKRARNKVSSLSKSDYDNCFKKSSQRKRRTAKKDVNVTTSKEIKTNIDSNEEFKTKDQSTRRPFLCSICSKILKSKANLQRHELRHQENRERNFICSVCGFKTFEKTILTLHMRTHDRNREKKHKCEHCEKAFFNSGALTIHRRIHLGQMIKCSLCPKEFFRQVDVDRHMPSHSLAPLSTNNSSKRSTYRIQCKECGKKIRNDNFSSHRATHSKEPFAKCTLCDKVFYGRIRCTTHMRRVHKRMAAQYDDIVSYYDTYRPRLTHALIKQQEFVIEKIQNPQDSV